MTKRENSISPQGGRGASVLKLVEAFLNANYPAIYSPAMIAKETGLDYEGVKKAVQNLLKKDRIKRPPRAKRGYYMGVETAENIYKLEDPPVMLHNMTWHIEVKAEVLKMQKGKKQPGPPLGLYSTREKFKASGIARKFNNETPGSWYEVIEYWHNEGTPQRVTMQFYDNSVTVHLNATNKPVQEIQFSALVSWVLGIIQGYGVNIGIIEAKLVKAEMNKDYKKITITPSMLELRDLLSKSWLRIYRKTWNLTRLELGTTYEGDKELLDLFLNFGRPQLRARPDDEDEGPGVMFQ